MSKNYILTLNEVNKTNIDLVGGKGANLGELITNDFPVPNGFCIHVNAYKNFILANELQEHIARILMAINWQDITDIEEKSAMIR